MLGMTDILDLLRLKLSKNWLTFIGKNMVIELQPSSTRCTFVENRPKNPSPISLTKRSMLIYKELSNH